jgi:hypothetical protein
MWPPNFTRCPLLQTKILPPASVPMHVTSLKIKSSLIHVQICTPLVFNSHVIIELINLFNYITPYAASCRIYFSTVVVCMLIHVNIQPTKLIRIVLTLNAYLLLLLLFLHFRGHYHTGISGLLSYYYLNDILGTIRDDVKNLKFYLVQLNN